MPRYYFDLINGEGHVPDQTGTDLPATRDSLLKEVSRILTDLAREELPEGRHGEIRVDVRDERGESVLLGWLDFRTEWRE